MNQSQLDLINRIDTNFNIIFRTARIRIERTKTSKEAIKIEQEYVPKIKRVFKQVVKEYDGKLHLIYLAEKRYGTEVKLLIKSMVTKSYLLGVDYISRSVKKTHLEYFNSNDLTQIMLKSDEAYRMFWRLVTKYLQVLRNRQVTKVGAVTHKKKPDKTTTNVTLTDEIFNTSDWDDTRLLNLDTNAALITSGIVTSTIALATLQKYKDYKQQQNLLDEAESLDTLFDEFDEFGEGEGGGEIPQGEIGDTVVFATENDAKVCPTCSSLEGMEWDVDDPSITVPQTDTHPRCRCRLLLKIDGKILAK